MSDGASRRNAKSVSRAKRGLTDMLEQYLPILIFILFGLLVGAVLLTLGSLVSPIVPIPKSCRRTSAGSRHSRMRE